jgi:disulfide bond formation protein DsbB
MPQVNQPITLIATVIFSVLVLAGLHVIYGLVVWLLFVLIGLIIGIYVAALRFLRKNTQFRWSGGTRTRTGDTMIFSRGILPSIV